VRRTKRSLNSIRIDKAYKIENTMHYADFQIPLKL